MTSQPLNARFTPEKVVANCDKRATLNRNSNQQTGLVPDRPTVAASSARLKSGSPSCMRALLVCCVAMVGTFPVAAALGVEVITVRSGQNGGLPGAVGTPDDIITFNPWGNPPFAPVLGTPFVPADFAATVGGSSAVVISPVGAWMSGATAPLSDPMARWINFGRDSGGTGTGGSALYAVPFFVNTNLIASATLTVEGGVDDLLGEVLAPYLGPNPAGLYVNGVPSGLSTLGPADFNFGVPTTHTLDITSTINSGPNHFFFYQRDAGGSPSGLIFSARIDVVPCETEGNLANLIANDGMICSGDKKFNGFAYHPAGDMPSADQIDVVATTDGQGNLGIRFIGPFVDQFGDGPSDALLEYTVTATDPHKLISDVHLAANTRVIGDGYASITETFLPEDPNTSLAVYDLNPGPTQLSDWADLTIPQRSLHVQKDILMNAASASSLATLSFIDQTFSQVPEPSAATLWLLGISLVLVRRSRGDDRPSSLQHS